MGSNGSQEEFPHEDQGSGADGGYVAPAVTVLGTLADLTKQGTAPVDELLNDGIQS